ncbi:MAG TPA: hydroxymethylglutaryl-CoA lyase [Chitinophagaceae bacterium]|jgi:hydroxymethylglutaryl-CoA lyase|nr:hydroxymethylglutaryl-CoA lyase [Chitinophagaceae bacterium]
MLKLVECPRDAMQGWKNLIPTHKKVEYINSLLKVGFHTIDFGSFVSPKAIPQMSDTKQVIQQLDIGDSKSKLLAIVANKRGAEEAAAFERIDCLGFPFSLSETFQQRNTNASMADALERVKEIKEICSQKNKELIVYLSMGFGNPYGDPYSEEIVFEWADKLVQLEIKIISLADTVGMAKPEDISHITSYLVTHIPEVEIGVHLHSTANNWREKTEAAYNAGCRRFDGALKGIGGCPMANDDLIGNMNTEWMISYFKEKNVVNHLYEEALNNSLLLANQIFV